MSAGAAAAAVLTRVLNGTKGRGQQTASDDLLAQLLGAEPATQPDQGNGLVEYARWVREDLPQLEADIAERRQAEADEEALASKTVAELFAEALRQANEAPPATNVDTHSRGDIPLNGPAIIGRLRGGLGSGTTVDGV